MSIQETLAKAKADAESKAPATALTTAPAPGAVVPAGARMGASDFLNNARANVDAYLKVSEHGLTIGTDTKKLIEEFDAVMDCSQIKFCSQVRFGKPAQYYKTYDQRRVADGSGRAWSEILAMAKSVDASRGSDPYSTAELYFTTTDQVVSVKGEKSVEAGTKLSYTPPYTGTGQLSDLLTAITQAGGDMEKSKVKVKVGYEAQARNGNNWGIVTFKLISVEDASA